MNKIKKYIWISAIFTFVCIVLYKVPYVRKIDKEIKAVQFRLGDSDYEEDIIITINGVYKSYLFKDDVYDGIITIDKYDFTHEYPLLMPITLSDGTGILFYGGSIKGKLVHELFGSIICTAGFDKLFLTVLKGEDGETGWNGMDGLCICGPAENREQAFDIIRELSSEDNMLSYINLN